MIDQAAESERIRDEALDLVLKLATRPDDAGLRAELAAWREQSPVHDRAYRVAAEAWLLGGGAETGDALKAAPGASRPQGDRPRGASRGTTASARRPGRRAARLLVSAAAVVAIALLVEPIVRLQLEADYLTGVGEMESFELEDGSTVDLDAESALAVAYSPDGRRAALLAGNAFFDVRHEPERPFHVDAAGLGVEVVGTAFAVMQRAKSTRVAVESGTVRVRLERTSDGPMTLEQGDQLTIDAATGEVRLSEVVPSEIAAWRRGLILADRMLFEDLVSELDRYHRGLIWVASDALARGDVTGIFDLSDPITALIVAADTQNAEVTQVSPFLLVVTPR